MLSDRNQIYRINWAPRWWVAGCLVDTDKIKGFWPLQGLGPLFNWGPGSTLADCERDVLVVGSVPERLKGPDC